MKRPPAVIAPAFYALRWDHPNREGLQRLRDSEWKQLLHICDRMQLTIPLAGACEQASAPAWVLEHMRRARENTRKRNESVWSAYREIASKLERDSIEFAVLKGFAGEPEFVADARMRVQYDLDVLVPGDAARRAYESICGLGYAPAGQMSALPTDHLPVLVRQTGWSWRGDYFDPEIPISVDVHFRLWDRDTERFEAPGWEEFWGRRVWKDRGDARLPALCAQDALAYHCLHLLRHLLRGDLRFGHVYELGFFLQAKAEDRGFWSNWMAAHRAELRRLQAICFGLAREWFACRLSEVASAQIADLPSTAHDWLQRYAFAPVHAVVTPNKHELWLHLGLLDSWDQRKQVLRRRLFPAPQWGPSGAVFVPLGERTVWVRLRHGARLLWHRIGRVWHHARTFPAVLRHGLAWWLRLRVADRSTGSRSGIGLE